jgi:uncharacterized membrane protein YfcA
VGTLINDIGIGYLGLAIAAMFGGAAAQAAIGMGLNLFTVGILALINPVLVPVPILLNSCLLSILASFRLRRDVNLREVGLAVVGLLIGSLLAMAVLALVSLDYLPRVFGLLIVVGVVLTVLGARLPLTANMIIAASAAAGAMGTIAGVHGPPIALVYQRESPSRIRAALLPFFAVANPISLLALASIGHLSWRELYASMLLLPGLIAGYQVAPWLISKLSPKVVRSAILLMSAVSGLALLIRG